MSSFVLLHRFEPRICVPSGILCRGQAKEKHRPCLTSWEDDDTASKKSQNKNLLSVLFTYPPGSCHHTDIGIKIARPSCIVYKGKDWNDPPCVRNIYCCFCQF